MFSDEVDNIARGLNYDGTVVRATNRLNEAARSNKIPLTDKDFIIKKDEKNVFDSVLNEFSKSFSLEKLRAWFDKTKKCVCKNEGHLRKKIADDHEVSIEEIYSEHYSPEILTLYFSQSPKRIFPEAPKQVATLKPEEIPENS